MLSRDLFATVVKTFFAELDDVRDSSRNTAVESPYLGFYTTYLKRDREWFLQAPVAEITTFFADDPIHKLEMLAELFYRETRCLTDAEVQGIMFRKIIELYHVVDTHSSEFSIERMNRIAEVQRLLEG